MNVDYIPAKHVWVLYKIFINLTMCDVNSLYGIADCVGLCNTRRPVETFAAETNWNISSNILHGSMQFLNLALVSLLAIHVMIVKRSQDVSYWNKIITPCYTAVSCRQEDNGCRKSVTNVVWWGQREAAPLTDSGSWISTQRRNEAVTDLRRWLCQSVVPFHWQQNDFTTYGVANPAEIANRHP